MYPQHKAKKYFSGGLVKAVMAKRAPVQDNEDFLTDAEDEESPELTYPDPDDKESNNPESDEVSIVKRLMSKRMFRK